jgi:hypothetical protein
MGQLLTNGKKVKAIVTDKGDYTVQDGIRDPAVVSIITHHEVFNEVYERFFVVEFSDGDKMMIKDSVVRAIQIK